MNGKENQNLIMRLRKKDYLQLVHNNREIIVQIAYFTKGIFALVEHFEANVDGRVRDKKEELKYIFKSPGSLQTSNAKRVTVSPSGIVKIYH
ncbi:MAG: hypothetical protein GY761_13715 [Hyphomicrobiales bacterium]|nr:hypothetical protein [Hyphomicrobiales bacterium]